jgi:Asp-tRNA(Asn)/Glu-tRNA(Gln) amidotransferase C subunit
MKIGINLNDVLHAKIVELSKKEQRSFRAQLEKIIEQYFKTFPLTQTEKENDNETK